MAHRVLLTMGFIFSFLTDVSMATLIYPALFTYPISVLLRGFGWIFLGRRVSGFYYLTGFLVLIFGALLYLSVVYQPFRDSQLGKVFPLYWIIYSVFELLSYISLGRLSTSFYAACISILGIAIVSYMMISQTIPGYSTKEHPASSPAILALFATLSISSLMAAISSSRLRLDSIYMRW
ncbi:MAG: hypothetical protein QXQ57_04105 [Sulfolobales archaeon]